MANQTSRKTGRFLPGAAREPMYGSEIMAHMAMAAQMGGAVAIRANTPEDIRAIRAAVKLPIIGLYKMVIPGFDVYITPTLTHAVKIAEAGAEIISIDATQRPHPEGVPLAEYIRRKRPKRAARDWPISPPSTKRFTPKKKAGRMSPRPCPVIPPTARRLLDLKLVSEMAQRINILWPKGAATARTRRRRRSTWGLTPSSSVGQSPDRLKSPPILFRRWKTWIDRTQIHSRFVNRGGLTLRTLELDGYTW